MSLVSIASLSESKLINWWLSWYTTFLFHYIRNNIGSWYHFKAQITGLLKFEQFCW